MSYEPSKDPDTVWYKPTCDAEAWRWVHMAAEALRTALAERGLRGLPGSKWCWYVIGLDIQWAATLQARTWGLDRHTRFAENLDRLTDDRVPAEIRLPAGVLRAAIGHVRTMTIGGAA
jgi:hypothetical protein